MRRADYQPSFLYDVINALRGTEVTPHVLAPVAALALRMPAPVVGAGPDEFEAAARLQGIRSGGIGARPKGRTR
jgi:hypothetical protein